MVPVEPREITAIWEIHAHSGGKGDLNQRGIAGEVQPDPSFSQEALVET